MSLEEINNFNERLGPEKQIINVLDEKINYFQNFFDYFNLNVENFSKSLQNDLNLITPLIKSNEHIFTSSLKQKLIFDSNDDKKDKEEKNQRYLNIMILMLKKLNLELKTRNEKFLIKEEADSIKFKKETNDPVFDKTVEDFRKIEKAYMTNYTTNQTNFDRSQVEKLLNDIGAQKKEIEEIYAKNEEIKQQKKEMEDRLKYYCDLPHDINQIKQLIEIKEEEFKALKAKKKK